MGEAERAIRRREAQQEAARAAADTSASSRSAAESRSLSGGIQAQLDSLLSEMRRADYPGATMTTLDIGRFTSRRKPRAGWQVASWQGAWNRDGYSTDRVYLLADGRLVHCAMYSTKVKRMADFTPSQLKTIESGLAELRRLL